MKFVTHVFAYTGLSFLAVSCMAPVSQQSAGNVAGGTYQDPNNPYAVPGVTTQGGGYAPAVQSPVQVPTPVQSAPYQPVPSTAINPPATIPSYTPPSYTPPVTTSTTSSGGSHTVTSGDTLWGLSRKYGVSVDEIRQANGISGSTIITGQSLNIPQ